MMHQLRHRRARERLAATLIASSVRSIMSKSMWVLVPALCAAPLASAEIFKCVGKNGTDLYQNFPCEFDSLGSLSSRTPSATTSLPPGDASKAKAKAALVEVASSAKSVNAREPRIGMWSRRGQGDLRRAGGDYSERAERGSHRDLVLR